MLNPEIKFAKSKGIDVPLMYVYVAGYMSGEKLKECTEWRLKIRDHFRYYEVDETPYPSGAPKLPQDIEYFSYPIAFLDPFNGKEIDTIDKKGITSSIPANAIRRGDKMSVSKADIVIANMNTFGAERPMIGTHHELRWAGDMEKPRILIVPEKDLELYKTHPFTSDCDYFLTDVQQLFDEKILESFYRRIAGAIYEG